MRRWPRATGKLCGSPSTTSTASSISCASQWSDARPITPRLAGRHVTSGDLEQQPRDGLYVLALFLLASPFYLNDFANIYVKDWRWWLCVDYAGVKLFPFLVVLWLIRGRNIPASEFGLARQSTPSFLAAFLVL